MRAIVTAVVLCVPLAAGASPEEARAFKAQGDGLVQRGKADDAIAAYESAIKADPEWLIAYDALAASLFAAGKFDDVVKRLQPLVDKHADYANGWYSLGYAYRKSGKNAESLAAYQHYVKLRPDDAEAYYGMGRAALALDKKEDAVAAFEKYVAMEKRPTELRWVEKAKVSLAELKKAGAKPAKLDAEAGGPGDRMPAARAAALADQGDAAVKASDWQKAYDFYLKARTTDGSSTRAYDGAGEVGLRLRKYTELVTMFRGAVRDNPGYSAGYYYLGRALSETGKKPEALEAMRRFASLQPTNPEGQLELGLLLKTQGDKDGATKALKKYLEVENRPGHEAPRKSAQDALKELGQ